VDTLDERSQEIDVSKGRIEMALRQLAERNADGIVVQLFWNDSAAAGGELFLEYRDERENVFFTLNPPTERALEAFYHPNAFRANGQRAA
jgi:hypothetical protein